MFLFSALQAESVKAELYTEIKELKEINWKQSMELAREQKRNEELTKAASLQSQLTSQSEEAKYVGASSEVTALQEENKGLTSEVESLRKELAALRSQSITSSSEAIECKRLTTEVQFLSNELNKQRARCTDLEVKLRSSSSSSGQTCRFCEVLRSQLADKEGLVAAAERSVAVKESALAERDARLSLLTTKLQKFEIVAQNTATVVSESKKMAVSKSDLEVSSLYYMMVSEAMHMKMGWEDCVCVEGSVVQALCGHILSLALQSYTCRPVNVPLHADS